MMSNPTSGGAGPGQRAVLIVDNTPEDRRVYQGYLLQDEDLRYRALEAETGREAIAICREAQPECVLLNYRLPDINGLEVLAAITEGDREAACPVVMLTEEEDAAISVAALKAGAQDCLDKTALTPVALLRAVSNAVERAELRRENERQRRALIEQNRKLEEALAAQKALDKVLRESQERLKGVIESAMDAIITVDDRQRIVIFNAAAERMLGCRAAEVIGEPISRFIPEQSRAAHEAHVHQFGESGGGPRRMGTPVAVKGRRAGGEEFPVEASISQVDVAGQRLFTVILRDITERKRAEDVLKRYELLSELARDIVLLIRRHDGRIIEANHSAVAAYGYDRETLLKMNLFELRAPGTSPDVATQMARADTEGVLFETLHRRKDGSLFPVEVSSVGADIGGERMLLGVIRDITERRRIERERNLLLQREQQARQLAEDANRAKDEFLAVVTHELRSPLNAMLGYARVQLARREIDPEDARRAFETIRRNGERQKALIDDLLDTARIITGKLKLEISPVDLAGVVNDAVETLRPAADRKLITLTSALDPRLGRVTGDAERLRQVAWNLLANAIKFTPERGRVEVRLERSGGRVTLTVSDTGQGISPEFLPRVFDRFTQQDASHSRRHSGLGLGLALVKQLVEMHGGEIKAASEGEGKGATFSVTLPDVADRGTGRQGDKEKGGQGEDKTRKDRVERTNSPASLSSSPPSSPSSALPLSGVSVLLVDDEEDARGLIAKALEDSGADVVAVSSALEAFAMITEPPRPGWPDVLVSDIAMPEEDGHSLMRRIRDWEQARGVHLPSVALTALNRAEDRINALGAGYKMHIAKPVEPEEMVAVVKSLAAHGGRSGDRRRKAHTD